MDCSPPFSGARSTLTCAFHFLASWATPRKRLACPRKALRIPASRRPQPGQAAWGADGARALESAGRRGLNASWWCWWCCLPCAPAHQRVLDLLHREGVQLRRQLGRDGEVARLGAAHLVQVPAGHTRTGACTPFDDERSSSTHQPTIKPAPAQYTHLSMACAACSSRQNHSVRTSRPRPSTTWPMACGIPGSASAAKNTCAKRVLGVKPTPAARGAAGAVLGGAWARAWPPAGSAAAVGLRQVTRATAQDAPGRLVRPRWHRARPRHLASAACSCLPGSDGCACARLSAIPRRRHRVLGPSRGAPSGLPVQSAKCGRAQRPVGGRRQMGWLRSGRWSPD